MKKQTRQYMLEMLVGLFFACVILISTLASAIDIPFIYQGF